MKKKTFFGIIGVVTILVLASLTSIVGSNESIVNNEMKNVSPLFSFRMDKKLFRDSSYETISDFVGQGRKTVLFSSNGFWFDAAAEDLVDLIKNRPEIIFKILDLIYNMPRVADILEKSGIQKNDLASYINSIKNNPDALELEIDRSVKVLNSPVPMIRSQPLGLSTSNPLGCLIVGILMAPVAVILGLIIGTMTIVTCFVSGCLESVVQNIFDSIIQGLSQPDG